MRFRLSFYFALAAAPAWLALSARAEKLSGAITMDVKTYQSRSTLKPSKDHPGEDWFYLTSASDDVEFAMRMSMSGQQDVVQKGRTDVNEVPGVTPGVSGYKRARVETFGNDVTLVIETKLTRKKKQNDKETEEKEDTVERIPLQLRHKPESLAGLKQGKTLECQVTKAGLKAMLERAKARTIASVNGRADGAGASVSASGWSKLLDSSRKGAVFISEKRIQYEAPPTRVHAEVKMRVNSRG